MRTARSSSRPGGVSIRHPQDHAPPPGTGTPPDQAPPRGQTHACKHITLPQTSFAGGNDMNDIY